MDQIDEIIARELLFGARPGEAKFPVTIEVGRPFWSGHTASEWACAVKVEPFHSHKVYGEGSLQALSLALQLIRSELSHFREEGGSLLWEDGQEWSLEAFWPLEPY
jgi:hypothetical protein